MCGHRLDPHAEHVAVSANNARRDRRGGARRGAGGGGERAPAPAHPHRHAPPPRRDRELSPRSGPKIRPAADVVLTSPPGGAPTMSIEERLQPALKLKPE